jgi:hypothetical protein
MEFQGEDAGGCSNIFIHKSSVSGKEVLIVDASKDDLGLSTTPKSFDLESAPNALSVRIDAYSQKAPQQYCTDVITTSWKTPATWRATRGSITITLSDNSAGHNVSYTVTAQLRDIRFEDGNGNNMMLPELTLKDVSVGWLPG